MKLPLPRIHPFAQTMQMKKGSAPASGAVSRASRLTQALEMHSRFGLPARVFVRPGAVRTAAEAAALPGDFNCIFRFSALEFIERMKECIPT